MNKLITLTLLFTLNSFAQEMDPNILVNALQTKHLTVNPNQCHETDKDKRLAKECIESICGKADPKRSVYTTGEELLNLKDEAIEKQFQADLPEIKQNIEVGAKYTKKLIEELKGRKESLSYSEKQSGDLILNSLIPNLDIQYDSETSELSINHDQYAELSKTQKKFFDQFKNKLSKEAKWDWEIAHQLGLPISAETILDEIKALKQSINNLEEKDKVTKETLEGLKWVESNAKRNPNQKFLYTLATYLYGMKSSLSSKVELKKKTNLCEDLKCPDFIKSYVTPELDKKIEALELSLKKYDEIGAEAIANKCKSAYYYDDIEKKYTSTVMFKYDGIKRVMDYVKAKFSRESAKKFQDYIDYGLKVNFNNKNIFGQTYIEQLKVIGNQEAITRVDMLDKIGTKSDYNLVKSLNDQIFYGMGMISQLQLLCKSDMTNEAVMIDDHYNPILNSMKISHHTCNHPDMGQDVFAHELGHVFSDLIAKETSSQETKKTYLRDRSCVSSQYLIPEYKGMHLKVHYSDHFRSEEDMADYFSAMVANHEFTKTKKNTTALCALLPVKGNEYGDLSTENTSYDPHTVAFLRVLREAIYKGQELSDSCLEVAKKNKHLWKFKDCSGTSAGMDK